MQMQRNISVLKEKKKTQTVWLKGYSKLWDCKKAQKAKKYNVFDDDTQLEEQCIEVPIYHIALFALKLNQKNG